MSDDEFMARISSTMAPQIVEMARKREALHVEVTAICTTNESAEAKCKRITDIATRYRPAEMLSLLIELVTRERLQR